MVYYDDDEVLNEIHDELYQQEEERPKSGFSTLNDNTKFWFMFFLGGIALMVILNKIELKTALMIGGVGAIILFFMSREST